MDHLRSRRGKHNQRWFNEIHPGYKICTTRSEMYILGTYQMALHFFGNTVEAEN